MANWGGGDDYDEEAALKVIARATLIRVIDEYWLTRRS
jgi:hypothetical protein